MGGICGTCNKCCHNTLIKVEDEDILRWKKEQRYDILLCLKTWTGANRYLMQKPNKAECIYLTEKGCEIHDTRPKVCKAFPKSWWQVYDFGCLLTPKTHKKRKV